MLLLDSMLFEGEEGELLVDASLFPVILLALGLDRVFFFRAMRNRCLSTRTRLSVASPAIDEPGDSDEFIVVLAAGEP